MRSLDTAFPFASGCVGDDTGGMEGRGWHLSGEADVTQVLTRSPTTTLTPY